MGKSVTYTEATNTRAEARQEAAREACKGNDARGGLLGRMAGAVKGGALIYEGGSAGGNAGSRNFMALAQDHEINWDLVK